MSGASSTETADRVPMTFIFLICTERSGSNFITSRFNGHGRVCGPSPTHLFRLFATNEHRYGDLAKDDNWSELIDDVILNFEAQLGLWATTPDRATLHERAGVRSAAELLRLIYESEAAVAGADHLFVKENHAHVLVPYLRAHFAGCRFVHVVRDPRDVAASWLTTQGIPGGVERAVDTWESDQAATVARLDDPEFGEGILTLRYEDLLDDAEGQLRRACSFVGLEFDDGMLRAHENRLIRENADRIDAWANLGRPVLRQNAGKYRTVLSDDDLRYVELRCGELMDRFGYECETARVGDTTSRDAEIDALRERIDPGSHVLQPEEESIRDQRRSAMDRVLLRSPSS